MPGAVLVSASLEMFQNRGILWYGLVAMGVLVEAWVDDLGGLFQPQ